MDRPYSGSVEKIPQVHNRNHDFIICWPAELIYYFVQEIKRVDYKSIVLPWGGGA